MDAREGLPYPYLRVVANCTTERDDGERHAHLRLEVGIHERLVRLREGFEVHTTAYGEEAVKLAQTESIDLITLDMMLPDITGMEVLHQIKSDPETADIPVIIVSVLLPEQTGEAERGAVDHITKPFAFEKLMESIRRTLGVSQMASMGAPQ